MKKIIIIFLCMILISGCNNNKEIEITMDCNGNMTKNIVKENDKLLCELLNDEYEFIIKKISNDTITIKTDKDGISSGSGILKSEKRWTIKKGEKLKIHTNSTDWQNEVEFSF